MIYTILFVSFLGKETPLVRFINHETCTTTALSLNYQEKHFHYYCKNITKKNILQNNPLSILSLSYCDGGQWCQF